MPGSFEEFDDYAWKHGQGLFLEWKKILFKEEIYYGLGKKVQEHANSGFAKKIDRPEKGAFNVHYRVHFAHGPKAIIRIPIPAYFQYAEEKLLDEVAAMSYISNHTSIPIPLVHHHGSRNECPGNLGPFIIMEWIENEGDLVDILNSPGLSESDTPVLNPDIDEMTLENVYSEVADVLLQLSRCEFEVIGSLRFPDGDSTECPGVSKRPLSLNMSQLANFARVPHFLLPPTERTFGSSSEYYSALADMHLQQLSFQRNQAIDSADDCRKKYIAR